ncbi:MAG: acyl-CoA dehydrogenase family protein [candidate division WOR-3 bacterium]
MELSKEVQLLQSEVRKFARDVIAEKVDEFDKNWIYPKEIITQLGAMGLCGATIPEVYGGCLLDTVSLLVGLEEISRVCPSTALILLAHNILFSHTIVKFGNEEQKKRYLPDAASGRVIGGFAEFATNELTVKEENGCYRITGRNHILLNGDACGPFILFVESAGKVNALIIDDTITGIKRNRKNNIIGMNAGGINEIIFDDCTVPLLNQLKGEGNSIMAELKLFSNLGYSALNLGIAEAAMENAIKYAKERVQFGEPIINFGMVREMIADMATQIESVRLLLYDAAVIRDNGKDFTRASALARYLSNQMVAEVTTNAIQVYGGYGYMKDYPVERYFRDGQVSRVLGSSGIELKELIVNSTI